MIRATAARAFAAALLTAGTALWAASTVQAQPRVVVSIKPVHALVAAVMEGVAAPGLLMHGGASPHSYTLRPSEARALQGAQVVFWVGPGLEASLRKSLATLAREARLVALTEAPGLRLLPAREGGAWGARDHDDEAGRGKPGDAEHPAGGAAGAAGAAINPHLWLDPRNAQALVRAIAATLASADPAHAAAYRANAARTLAGLAALDAELATRLRPVQGRPFLVFHDAYPYLEARYGLNAVGAITVNPEQSPGARRVRELRARIQTVGAVCVFAEPQFEPRLVATLVEGSTARAGVLDPLGADLPQGPGLYAALMRGLAADALACLGQ